jgi:uncharacterized protein YbjT (DUF2867 family)
VTGNLVLYVLAMKVLVTGATGYIGGRLVPRLLDHGFEVRCMTRDSAKLSLDPWRDEVEVVAADALDPTTLAGALADCDTAYYLIHSMGRVGEEFSELDRRAALNFAAAADAVGLRRIVYLGGLGSDTDELSAHLASRKEVGRIFAAARTPVTELRAAVIIGSGSVSFEVIRHLTEILPVIMRSRWMRSRCQPIAVRNVLEILISVIDDPEPVDRLYDIGGPDILTYEEMMQGYARVAGLPKRLGRSSRASSTTSWWNTKHRPASTPPSSSATRTASAAPWSESPMLKSKPVGRMQ